MKVLRNIGITIGVIIIILVLVAGYFGFVPGVSDLFGSNRAKDLGVKYTAADYTSARVKTGTTITDLPAGASPEQSIKFSGQRAVNTTFSQAEYNALLNNRAWEYYPLSDCQLKINPDATVEFSAKVNMDRLEGFAQAMGGGKDPLRGVSDYLKFVPTDPAIYARGTAAVVNGQVTVADISDFKVGNLSLTGQVKDNLSSLINFAENQMSGIPGFSVKSFKFVNGQVQFEGTLPDTARSKSQ